MFFLSEDSFQHEIIENSIKIAQQRNFTQLDFNLYLDFCVKTSYQGKSLPIKCATVIIFVGSFRAYFGCWV